MGATRRAARVVGALAVAAAVLVGCGGEEESADDERGAPASIMVGGKYSDERFIDMMVPHHQMAIEMAEEALEESGNRDILDLSERVVRGQSNEIEELRRLREELYGSRQTPDEMHPRAMDSMGMGDHGADAQAESGHEHDAAPGPSDEFDRRFLDDMLAHHAAAIQHASLALVHSNNRRLKIVARDIVDEQAREIGMMGQWRLERWEHVL